MPQNILEATPFPECTTNCKCVKYFGVCECESICPWKFDQDGNPKMINKKNGVGNN